MLAQLIVALSAIILVSNIKHLAVNSSLQKAYLVNVAKEFEGSYWRWWGLHSLQRYIDDDLLFPKRNFCKHRLIDLTGLDDTHRLVDSKGEGFTVIHKYVVELCLNLC